MLQHGYNMNSECRLWAKKLPAKKHFTIGHTVNKIRKFEWEKFIHEVIGCLQTM